MSQHVAQLDGVPNRRLRALIVPREHGAWGMLLVPLVTGAAVGLESGDAVGPLLLFAAAALSLFWLRTPVESWLGTTPMRTQTAGERRYVAITAGLLTSAAGVLLAALFWNGNHRDLLLIGAAAGAAFGIQALIKRFGRSMRMPTQMIGAIGLTSCAPAAYYVAAGQLDSRAVALWAASWFFAADQIHFVQLRIHSGKVAGFAGRIRCGRAFLCGQIGMIAALLVLTHLRVFPALALGAFVPVLIRGLAWFAEKPRLLAVRRLGWAELAHAVGFGILVTAAFRIG